MASSLDTAQKVLSKIKSSSNIVRFKISSMPRSNVFFLYLYISDLSLWIHRAFTTNTYFK